MACYQHNALGGEFLLNRQIVLHRLTIFEGNPPQYIGLAGLVPYRRYCSLLHNALIGINALDGPLT